MKVTPVLPKILLLVVLGASLCNAALACNEPLTNAKTPESGEDGRTFLIDLQLSKSGRVRAIQVLMGAGPLRSSAVQAVLRRTYKPTPGYSPASISVQIKFPRGRDRQPEIREAMPAGISSCIYGGTPIQWPTRIWIEQMLSARPLIPFLPPAESNLEPKSLPNSSNETESSNPTQ